MSQKEKEQTVPTKEQIKVTPEQIVALEALRTRIADARSMGQHILPGMGLDRGVDALRQTVWTIPPSAQE